MTSPLDFHPSAQAAAIVVRGVRDDQLGRPSPSGDYTVGHLLDHLDGLTQGFAMAAAKGFPPGGSEAPSADADGLADGWRERIPAQLDAWARAWADPDAWEGMTEIGGVTLPGEACGLFGLDEVIVHGWDLARATGQSYEPDEVAVTACGEFIAAIDDEDRDPRLFGPPADVPAEASPLDRLVGLTGRDPGWTA